MECLHCKNDIADGDVVVECNSGEFNAEGNFVEMDTIQGILCANCFNKIFDRNVND